MSDLKAYLVQEEDEGTGGAVFARSNAHARRIGSQVYGAGDFDWGKAKRAPSLDRFAPGPVPKRVMIEECGWWWTCYGCERRIQAGTPDEDDEVGVEDAVEHGDAIYCSSACREDHLDRRVAEMHAEAEALNSLRDEAIRRWPGITVSGWMHAYVRDLGDPGATQVQIQFTFPGSAHGRASFMLDRERDPELRLFVPAGDLEAWRTFMPMGSDLAP